MEINITCMVETNITKTGNFARPHQTLSKGRKVTPAMAAGVAEYPWSNTQIAALLD